MIERFYLFVVALDVSSKQRTPGDSREPGQEVVKWSPEEQGTEQTREGAQEKARLEYLNKQTILGSDKVPVRDNVSAGSGGVKQPDLLVGLHQLM